MCGICGFSPSIGQRKDRQLIEAMKSYLYHRGPDGKGSYFSDDCAKHSAGVFLNLSV